MPPRPDARLPRAASLPALGAAAGHDASAMATSTSLPLSVRAAPPVTTAGPAAGEGGLDDEGLAAATKRPAAHPPPVPAPAAPVPAPPDPADDRPPAAAPRSSPALLGRLSRDLRSLFRGSPAPGLLEPPSDPAADGAGLSHLATAAIRPFGPGPVAGLDPQMLERGAARSLLGSMVRAPGHPRRSDSVLIGAGADFVRGLMLAAGPDAIEACAREDIRLGLVSRKLVALTWFLQALAVERGEGFDQGAFVLVDRERALTTYLMALTPRARPSSRLTSRGAQAFAIGLPPLDAEVALPSAERRLLFTPLAATAGEGADAPIQLHRLFLQPENFGQSFRDVFPHAWQCLVAQLRRAGWPGGGPHAVAGRRGERLPGERELEVVLDLAQEAGRGRQAMLRLEDQDFVLGHVTGDWPTAAAELTREMQGEPSTAAGEDGAERWPPVARAPGEEGSAAAALPR